MVYLNYLVRSIIFATDSTVGLCLVLYNMDLFYSIVVWLKALSLLEILTENIHVVCVSCWIEITA